MSPFHNGFLLLLACLFFSALAGAQQSTPSPTSAAITPTASSSSAADGSTASAAVSGSPSASVSRSSSSSASRPAASPPSSPGSGSGSGSSVGTSGTPPDVLLNVPNLSVGRIELDVEELKADINLAANVASLVSINAGVQVSVQKINITITDVAAELELVVRLGHLVDIVNRTFASLDLNPLLINTLNNVTSLVNTAVGAVDGLLGSITQGDTKLSFLIDNLGNIVQQVAGTAGNVVSSIVGDYTTNMTFTGAQQNLQNGFVQKTYSYSPLNSLVNIIFNSLGQVVQATVAKKSGSGSGSGGGGSSSSAVSSVPAATSTPSTPSAASSSSAPPASSTPAARR